jgi:poly(hydroxyalkanoate) granule-associated protein
MTTSEEIEVNVRQIDEQGTKGGSTPGSVFDVIRRMMLAGFGAFALTREEAEQFLDRLVERGEIAQKDAQHLIEEAMGKFRQPSVLQPSQIEASVSSITHQVETGLEQLLNRMNIPSKRDIDELSAKIAQLAVRVEELRRAGDGSTAKSRKVTEVKVEG